MAKIYTLNSKIQNWRIDEDGILRVTARVLAEGVYPYTPEESPPDAVPGADGFVAQYIPALEFTPDALISLEGKPVIVQDHVWRNASNTMKDGLTVGAVAGTPRVEDNAILADLIISDNNAIDLIKKGELVEVSAAYEADCTTETGIYNAETYACVQRNLRFNHVLLLPYGAGRCGRDVRIINKNTTDNNLTNTGQPMATIIKRQIGNKNLVFKFENEDDAQTANEMCEEEKKFNAEQLNEAMEVAEQLKNEIAEKQATLDDALKTIQAQKEEIDKLLSSDVQEELAKQAADQMDAEDLILDDAIENEVITEEDKEEIQNSFKSCKTFADRRRVLVQNAMQIDKKVITEWPQDSVDGAYEALRRQASIKSKKSNKKTVMGGTQSRKNNSGLSNLERILKPMKLQNKKD